MKYKIKEGFLVDKDNNIVHCDRKEEMANMFGFSMDEYEETMKMFNTLGFIKIHDEKEIPSKYWNSKTQEDLVYYSIPVYDEELFVRADQIAKSML